MELEQVKKLINEAESSKKYRKYVKRGRTAERYARCKNDILKRRRGGKKSDIFKKANHKIASPFFKMMLMQKSSYIFGIPPEIDVGDDNVNKQIEEILGPQWGKNLKKLCDVVSMWGDGWIQYWIDENNNFQYGVMDHSEDVIAGWGGLLNEQLVYTIKRAINWLDPVTAEEWNLYELWTEDKCSFYRYSASGELDDLQEEKQVNFNANTNEFTEENFITHEYGEVPFIYFRNNSMALNDLVGVKASIDAYDEARSSLADDIQDCDETIFVLSNNGGQDAEEFWNNVTENRLINLVSDPVIDGDVGKSDVKLLAIEPPIAAKQLSMATNKDDIQDLGGIVDPSPETLGNASGEAIKHTYNILELKACQLEDEFRIGINRLVEAICRYLGYQIPEGQKIVQTWKRTRINNDTELINNVAASVNILSQDTVIKNHPWAEPDELEKIAKEKLEERNQVLAEAQQNLIDNMNPYNNNGIQTQRSPILGTEVQGTGGGQTGIGG